MASSCSGASRVPSDRNLKLALKILPAAIQLRSRLRRVLCTVEHRKRLVRVPVMRAILASYRPDSWAISVELRYILLYLCNMGDRSS